MKSIFKFALILPLAAFSIGLVGCSEPTTGTEDKPTTTAPADDEKPAMDKDEDKDADEKPAGFW